MRVRQGITLVEVLVALVLVAVGLLGVAGSSALMLRVAVSQGAEGRALRGAELRSAALSAGGCDAARDGAVAEGAAGLRERWRVAPAVNGVRLVDDTLEWTDRGRARRLVVRSALLC